MPNSGSNVIRDCANHLSLTVGEVMLIAATAPRRYFVWKVNKRSGKGTRTLCHPARELKPIQYYFLHNVLNELPVHSAATAYVSGSSIRKNAAVHIQSRVILKLDFVDFFNSLEVESWIKFAADNFPNWNSEEIEFSCRILFWGAHSPSPRCLAIGAPTSPMLSNALMYDVDAMLQAYADEAGLNYTRYADDITFSSTLYLDRDRTISAVNQALANARYTSVRLKAEKTILVSNKLSRRVTGLIITPDQKISLGRDRKRLISAMVHRADKQKLPEVEWPKLAGLLSFAKDAEPTFVDSLRRKYTSGLVDYILKRAPRDINS